MKKNEMFIDLLKRYEIDNFEQGRHRELSAWAVAVFYISILGFSFNYFNTLIKGVRESYYCGIISWLCISGIILLFCIVVIGFIHAQ
jgi:hypothetical protein